MNNLSLVRWAGGKGKQLRDLLPLIPPSKLYVEPFGGGGSVLLNKSPANNEVYNDLDEGLVNLFEVVRGEETFARFRREVMLTPYSRELFARALDWSTWDDPVSRAVGFYTVLNQSISGKRLARSSDWSRGRADNVATRWFARMDGLVWIHHRVQNVQIECRDALDVLQEWDTVGTTFYCDPPYVLDTRTKRKYYAVEPGDEWHHELIEVLLRTKGAVVLSGYEHPIYERLTEEGKWAKDHYYSSSLMEVVGGEKKVGGKERKGKRVEVVWRNPRAAEHGARRPLFHDYNWTEEGIEEGEMGGEAGTREASRIGNQTAGIVPDEWWDDLDDDMDDDMDEEGDVT